MCIGGDCNTYVFYPSLDLYFDGHMVEKGLGYRYSNKGLKIQSEFVQNPKRIWLWIRPLWVLPLNPILWGLWRMGWVLEVTHCRYLISDSHSIDGLRCMPLNRFFKVWRFWFWQDEPVIVFPLWVYNGKKGLDYRIEGLMALRIWQGFKAEKLEEERGETVPWRQSGAIGWLLLGSGCPIFSIAFSSFVSAVYFPAFMTCICVSSCANLSHGFGPWLALGNLHNLWDS